MAAEPAPVNPPKDEIPKPQVAELIDNRTAVDSKQVKDLKASLEQWQKTKDACGGNYTYVVSGSSFTGFRWATTVVIKDHKVVERSYQVRESQPIPVAPGTTPEPVKPQWVETGKDIGSNKQAAPAITVDELYALAGKIVETPVPADHVLSLGFNKDGLLSHCFTRDTRIADDAPLQGVPPFTLQLPKKE